MIWRQGNDNNNDDDEMRIQTIMRMSMTSLSLTVVVVITMLVWVMVTGTVATTTTPTPTSTTFLHQRRLRQQNHVYFVRHCVRTTSSSKNNKSILPNMGITNSVVPKYKGKRQYDCTYVGKTILVNTGKDIYKTIIFVDHFHYFVLPLM